MEPTVVAGLVIMSMSLIGVIFVGRRAEAWIGERLSYLVAFSAGVFLVTGGALVIEVFHIFEENPIYGIGVILLGYILAASIEFMLPETHHHHDVHDHHDHHGKSSARKIIVGDAIHNVTDGMMLVPAFLVSPMLGLAVTVSIVVHEALQEISEFFVMKQAGYSTKSALIINAMVSSTIFIGIGLAYFALSTHELEGVLLALSAGFFLHVVAHDLLPKRHDHETIRQFMWHILVLLCGLLLMVVVTYSIAGVHTHGEDDHAQEHAEHNEEVI